MQLYDLNTFFRLSADLNYQLVAKSIDRRSLLAIILDRRRLPKERELVLEETIEYLNNVYRHRKRRLGAQAIIHPLRAAAILARSMPDPQFLDLMAVLLHDRFEDFKPHKDAASVTNSIDDGLRRILGKLSDQEQWFLMERLTWLTKHSPETYYQYIGRMLSETERTPETVRVKLADRLDNTLDMRMNIHDAFEKVDFFEEIFQMMFLPKYRGFHVESSHPTNRSMNGAQRLYQLFKNITLLTLIRQRQASSGDAV
jgi:(p)ppGpp synthase/HD superfamily hydrolase